MVRLIAEIKGWSEDPEEVPRSHDDILRSFPVWLAKARIRAEREGVRSIFVLDALNQLEDQDHARLLGCLPSHPFTGPLRLIVSNLPGDMLEAVGRRGWASLRVQPLTPDERHRLIADYLARFGKKLDAPRLERLAAAPAAANPLYLKILLDELRVTGTHERLDERLANDLSAPDTAALLRMVLARYERDYERDRKGLVSEALGLIWAARRGLTETELLRLLRPTDLPWLPLATWAPLRAALEEGLVDRGGILNFAHDFLGAAVEAAFVPDANAAKHLRLWLVDEFEAQPITTRSCDELPWLLRMAGERDRLRACLLDIGRFLEINERDQDELMRHWVWLGEERTMGQAYVASFEKWSSGPDRGETVISLAANRLGNLLEVSILFAEAEAMYRRSLVIDEQIYGKDRPVVATDLNNLALVLHAMNRVDEAEPLMRRALAIDKRNYGGRHPSVAINLDNLALLLWTSNRLTEAEPLMRRALAIHEQSHGRNHPAVAISIRNLALLLQSTNQPSEAEPLLRRALAINEQNYGRDHHQVGRTLYHLAGLLLATNRAAEAEPMYRRALAIAVQSYGRDNPNVAGPLRELAQLLLATNRAAEAEPLLRQALAIAERSYGRDHPQVATDLNQLAGLLEATSRLAEAEPMYRRALAIDEQTYGRDHPDVARDLNNLAHLLQATNRLAEAEPMYRRALAIDERSYGRDHPDVATILKNFARLLQATDRLAEAEALSRRAIEILLKFTRDTNHPHRHLHPTVMNHARLLMQMGMSRPAMLEKIQKLGPEAVSIVSQAEQIGP
jgi:tetratricopeptide (TPR) repeat protein